MLHVIVSRGENPTRAAENTKLNRARVIRRVTATDEIKKQKRVRRSESYERTGGSEFGLFIGDSRQ